MTPRNPLPPREELLYVFRHDLETGDLLWMHPRSNRVKPGDRVGRRTKTGLQTSLNGKGLFVHRIIWKMYHDEEPDEIDHRDLDDFNNRLGNLRPATRSQNNMNRRVFKNSKTGYSGVGKKDDRYYAWIIVDRRRVDLGWHDTLDDAIWERQCAELEHYREYMCLQRKAA